MGLSLKLLGEFAVRNMDGAELALPTRKTRALLGYLAVHADKPQRRERLMTLLWSDRAETQARHSLNQALLSIRKLSNNSGVALLDGDAERVTLRSEAIDSDLACFRALLAGDPAAAARIYEGPFLDGIAVPDPEFQTWVRSVRSECQDLVCEALERAADAAAANGDLETAIAAARRLVALGPLREAGHRCLMRLLHCAGDRSGALRQYAACTEILRTELAIQPEAATKSLFEQIRSDALTDAAAESTARTQALATAISAPPVPDKPSIAVLPFDNMSDSREFEYLADGFTEDITTLLARMPGFFVIARNSSFAYKGRPRDVREVGRELGVRYVIEGSLRPIGSRFRITAQLIEATSGTHLWANRFDRPLDEIYEVQDEVVTGIMAQLEPELTRAEFEMVRRRAPSDMDACACYQQAHGLLSLKGWRRETFAEAADLLHRAIGLDPEFALAHAYLALIQTIGHTFGLGPEDPHDERKVIASAETAMDLDNQSSTVLGFVGCALCYIGQSVRGLDILERAVEIDPSNAQAWASLGVGLMRQGKVHRGVALLEHGMRISPLDHRTAYWATNLANALFRLGRIDEALEAVTLACRRDEKLYMARVVLALILDHLGRAREAREAMAEAFRIHQDLQVEQIRVVIGRRGVQILEQARLLSR